MTRSAEFGQTVKRGARFPQRDLVLHVHRAHPGTGEMPGPRVGLIVSKSVGNAVQRHRVSRRLRHCVADLLTDFAADDRVVIRALPGSRDAASAALTTQLQSGLRRLARARGTE